MRNAAIALALATGFLAPAFAQAGPVVTTTMDSPAVPDGICLKTADIERTSAPDDKTILFHLKTGQVWRNALVHNCASLSAKGFVYADPPVHGVVCGNLQQIRVNNSKETCILGQFTQETAPAAGT